MTNSGGVHSLVGSCVFQQPYILVVHVYRAKGGDVGVRESRQDRFLYAAEC